MIVMTRSQDHVEAINSTLRKAGHPVHCTWLPDASDLGDALTQLNPEMLIVFIDELSVDLASIMKVKQQTAPGMPVLVMRESVDEAAIAEAMRLGCQDVVTLANRSRLQSVASRELRSHRLERALSTTLSSAREYREQLQNFLEGSADAITHVQEGIIVDANRAWLELFGYSENDALTGTPLMDLFEQETHPALKGALVACLQGKWEGHGLKVQALLSDGSSLALELVLTRADYDNEPAVRIAISALHKKDRDLEVQLADAVKNDATTQFLQQRYLTAAMRERAAQNMKGGVRQIAHLKPDRFIDIQHSIGVLASEDFMAQLAELLRSQLTSTDLCGRFGGNGILVMLDRGTAKDVETWAENIVKRVHSHVFVFDDKTLSATVTVGLGLLPPTNPDVGAAITDAVSATRRGRELGGNQMYVVDKSDTDTRVQAYDKIWVRHIKSALMENRFRLVQQPIASLLGEDKGMFDVLVRMLDEQGNEVLPAEFIAAAERNDLMKNIDRWVVGASMSFAANRKASCIFVRLSKDTVLDKTLLPWLDTQLKSLKIEPKRICMQVTEELANQYVRPTKELAENLRKLGFRFALEHFGTGRDPLKLLNDIEMNFIKVDGSLMQGLSTNQIQQQRVKGLVEAAKRKGIETIAERVEDANTMAVLWQLGIEFIQGYFVNAPEDVTMSGDR
ncbi:MAG: multidomain signaling protein FimX [Gammaproteobacteria bacterium]|jgi:diguanylate cyclase (GGDEF)-like protein/PAS domain S-box-containing protein|nr:multidomain signaling protein FimX [Gammaproteobacteria bacterium]